MWQNQLKRQDVLVLPVMSFQLVPLVETLHTTQMITLKQKEATQVLALKRSKIKTGQECRTWYGLSRLW